MENKKIILLILVLVLITGTGTFVFANQNVNNDGTLTEDIDYRKKDEIPKKDMEVPVIKNDQEIEKTDDNSNELTPDVTPTEKPVEQKPINKPVTNPSGSTSSIKKPNSPSQGSGATINTPDNSLDIIQKLVLSVSNTQLNDTEVLVTIKANKEIKNIKINQDVNAMGWIINKKSATKVFDANVIEEVFVEDYDGQLQKITYTIATIKKEEDPEKNIILDANLNYSNTELTNAPVLATITATKNIKSVNEDGWNINKNVISKTFSKNASGKVTLTDYYDNIITLDYSISNIDSTPLKADITYENNGYYTIVYITTDEEISVVNDEKWLWTQDDAYHIYKKFYNNVSGSVKIYDKAHNATEVNYDINAIIDKPLTKASEDNGITTIEVIYKEKITGINNWELITEGEHKGEYKTFVKVNTNDENPNLPNELLNYESAPKLNISYSNVDENGVTEVWQKEVTVTISSDKDIASFSDSNWSLSDDKRSISRTFTSNQDTQTIEIFDNKGNSTIKRFKVDGLVYKIKEFGLRTRKGVSTLTVYFEGELVLEGACMKMVCSDDSVWQIYAGNGKTGNQYRTTKYTLTNLEEGIVEEFKIYLDDNNTDKNAIYKVKIWYENGEVKFEEINEIE